VCAASNSCKIQFKTHLIVEDVAVASAIKGKIYKYYGREM
jgi:hypothetical protein